MASEKVETNEMIIEKGKGTLYPNNTNLVDILIAFFQFGSCYHFTTGKRWQEMMQINWNWALSDHQETKSHNPICYVVQFKSPAMLSFQSTQRSNLAKQIAKQESRFCIELLDYVGHEGLRGISLEQSGICFQFICSFTYTVVTAKIRFDISTSLVEFT